VQINLNLAETVSTGNQASGLGPTASLSHVAVIGQLDHGFPNTDPSIASGKVVAHLLDGYYHTNFFATVSHENEAKSLAVLEPVDNGLATHHMLLFTYYATIIAVWGFWVNQKKK
jgi:hypothetical protein